MSGKDDVTRPIKTPHRSASLVLLAAIIPFAATGCDGLLRVVDPQQVVASDLERPEHAQLLVDGAIADFHCAFGHLVIVGGLLGTELTNAHSTSGQTPFDRRSIETTGGWYANNTCGDNLAAYRPISTARWTTDHVLMRLEAWTDAEVENRTRLIASAAVYAGYSHVLLGENFCTAAVDGGPELSRQQVFERAEERFTRAIEAAQASGSTEVLNLAYVGRARTRLNLGRGPEAVSDAGQVPADFTVNAAYSDASSRSRNKLFWEKVQSNRSTVAEPYRELTFEGVPDPRVPAVSLGRTGTDQQTEIWLTGKYASGSSPIRLASWVEAQLIIAEVEGGQQAVDIINMLHDRAELPHFQSSDPAEILAQVLEERARELFLEGHHLNDLIRHNVPFDPPPGTPYKYGGQYGDTRCMPLPDRERHNNPNM